MEKKDDDNLLVEPDVRPVANLFPDQLNSMPIGDHRPPPLQSDLLEPPKISDEIEEGTTSLISSDSETLPAKPNSSKTGLLRVPFITNGTSSSFSSTSTTTKSGKYSLLNLKKKKVENKPLDLVILNDEEKKSFSPNLLFKKLQKFKPKIISTTENSKESSPDAVEDEDEEKHKEQQEQQESKQSIRPSQSMEPIQESKVAEVIIDKNLVPESPEFRPSYHRSVSFQSRTDDDRRTLSSVSSSSISSEDENENNNNNNNNKQPTGVGDVLSSENTPMRMRQRSRTVDVLDHYKTRSRTEFPTDKGINFSPSKSTERQLDTSTGGFAHVNPPPKVTGSSMFSTLTNFVKARRSSSILALDEITRQVDHQSTPNSSISVELDIHSPSEIHETPTTPSFTDYFNHRSRLSSTNVHKSTNSINSIDKIALLNPHADEEPRAYINRLIISQHTTEVLLLICTKDSEFNTQCLEYFTTFFYFHDEPLDISLRKFLIFNELPKETQQIDRVLNLFSKEYCIQNPSSNLSVDLCFILTFSLLILHTDHFNPNNKRKMTKLQFVSIVKESLQAHLENAPEGEKNDEEFTVKNVITKDVLGYYYDNITFTPFKKLEECSKDLLMSVNNFKGAELLKIENDSSSSNNTQDIDITSQSSKLFAKANLSNSSLTPGILPRKRTSSFFVPISAGSDGIYDYILGIKDEQDLKLKYEFQRRNPYISILNGIKETSVQLPYASEEDNILTETEDRIDEVEANFFQKLTKTMLSSKPEIILRLKTARVTVLKDNSKVEIIGGDVNGSQFMTRVFKMGTIYRQEPKKLTSSTSWRSYFAVLTSIGLIFYKDSSYLKISKHTDENGKTFTILDEQTAVGFFDSAADSGFIIYNHGLFASRIEPDETKRSTSLLSSILEAFKFTIYGKNSRGCYSLTTRDEMVEWIFFINYLMTLSDCYLSTEPLQITYTELETVAEIRCSTSMKLLQKVNKSNKVLISSLDLLKKLFGVCNNFDLLMPFLSKTRELAIYSAQLLNTRINWCWFELNKNLFMVKVLLYAIDNHEEEVVDGFQSEEIEEYENSVNGVLGLERVNSLMSEKAAVASVLLVLNYSVDSSLSYPDDDNYDDDDDLESVIVESTSSSSSDDDDDDDDDDDEDTYDDAFDASTLYYDFDD